MLMTQTAKLLGKTSNAIGSRALARVATDLAYRAYENRPKLSIEPKSKAAAEIEKGLQRHGYHIIPRYWSAQKCQEAISEIDRVHSENKEFLSKNAKADKRLFGADRCSALIREFGSAPELLAAAAAYHGEEIANAFTLAAYMPYSPNNNGSGEGWHRDTFLRQVKAIIYLTNVSIENGPFELVLDSHLRNEVINDMRVGDLKYGQNRLSETDVDRILVASPNRKKTFTAEAGTLIVVDTSSIHRGKPIEAGHRYALTNYYYPIRKINPKMMKKFNVVGSHGEP